MTIFGIGRRTRKMSNPVADYFKEKTVEYELDADAATRREQWAAERNRRNAELATATRKPLVHRQLSLTRTSSGREVQRQDSATSDGSALASTTRQRTVSNNDLHVTIPTLSGDSQPPRRASEDNTPNHRSGSRADARGRPTERGRAISRQMSAEPYLRCRGDNARPGQQTSQYASGVATGSQVHRSQLSNHKRAPSQEWQRSNRPMGRDAVSAVPAQETYPNITTGTINGSQLDDRPTHVRYVGEVNNAHNVHLVGASAARPQSHYPEIGYTEPVAPPIPSPPRSAKVGTASTSTTTAHASGGSAHTKLGSSHTTYLPPSSVSQSMERPNLVRKASDSAYAAQSSTRSSPTPVQKRRRRDNASSASMPIQSASAHAQSMATAPAPSTRRKDPENYSHHPEARPAHSPSSKPFPVEPLKPARNYENEPESKHKGSSRRIAKAQDKCTSWIAKNQAYEQQQQQQQQAQLLQAPRAEAHIYSPSRHPDAPRVAAPALIHVGGVHLQSQQVSSSRAHGQYVRGDYAVQKDYRSGRH
ncbi:hypothetical protein OE88DRAFT_1187589 [Heliocybe sulcata]|uniref:Uncharacterized protein n=1 Tax=Heliocybe sulcata TaxID=5364 RepID=A0A5C3NAN8_9AGAM|nr:hypothetical protein OE88DRAFT_1187589 [Heliocybe sulcata]